MSPTLESFLYAIGIMVAAAIINRLFRARTRRRRDFERRNLDD